MAGEFPKIPSEAKSFNDMVAWAAEHGQAESVRELLDAAKSKDWDGALDAVHRLEGMSDLADKAGAIGKHFDTIDKVGKALEIAQAVEKGDYTYAGAKLGAEVVDSIASGYLDSLGPGGIMLNYAVHETGEVMSSYVSEAQQFGPNAGLAEASGNEAAVAAYQTNRDYMEGQIRDQVEAGRSPEEIQQWTHDHMDAHGAIYNNLDAMKGQGDGFTNRFEKDLDWANERTEAIANEDAAQSGASNDGPSFFTPFMEAAKETFNEMTETAGEVKDFVVDRLEETGKTETSEAIAKDDEPQPEQSKDGPGTFAQMSQLVGKLNETLEPKEDALEPEAEDLEVSVAPANSTAQIIDATPSASVPIEAVSTLEIPLPPQTEQPIEYQLEQPPVDLDQIGAHNDTPPQATEVLVETEMTETEKLDAYVSQMAREAEAQANEQVLAGHEPPLATEVVIVDASSDVIELAQPWEEHIREEASADTIDGPDSYT